MSPVTFEPMTELIVAVPVPLPLFVIEPVMLTEFVEIATLPVVPDEVSVRLPVPLNPPLIVVLPVP